MSMTPERFVLAEYRHVLEPHVPLAHRKAAKAALHKVMERYAEPHRVYHSVGHLADVLDQLRRWKFALSKTEYLEAFVALLLHDAVYHIPSKEVSNEELSAGLTGGFIADCGIWDSVDRDTVEEAIRITKGHQPVDKVSLAVCWCDLWGFTKDYETSKAISEQIRQEYLTAYSEEEYAEGRRQFLTSYRSPFKPIRAFFGIPLRLRLWAWWLNRKANKNLDRELAELQTNP